MPHGGSPLEVGAAGEDAALAVYLRAGYRLLARNWRCGLGEIDLVLARGGMIVFCEVKTRRGAGFGGPHEAVTSTKQRRLRLLALLFLEGHGLRQAAARFDVASVSVGQAGPSVHLFEQAF